MPREEYERYAGQWVAVKDGHALFGSPNGTEVFDWLDEHGIDGAVVIKLRRKGQPDHYMFASVHPAAT